MAWLGQGHLPVTLQGPYRRALASLDGLTVGEQLEIACQVVVSLLMGMRVRAEPSRAERSDFNLTCAAVEEWLRRHVAVLRFPGPAEPRDLPGDR